MFSTMHAYLSLLFSHFVFLFLPSFSYSSIYETHSAIYNVWFDFITTLPKYHGDKKTLHSQRRKKKRRVSNNQNKYCNIIIFGTKYELFLPPYQITFFLAFGQATANYFLTKNFLIIHTDKHFKIRKEYYVVIVFSQSPKVIFWMNCAFPLRKCTC